MKKFLTLVIAMVFSSLTWGQTYLNESFDNATFPPTGWTQTQLSGTGLWDRQTAGTNPACAPHSGAGMVRYNCYSYSAGVSSVLISPVVDLTAVTATTVLEFWMYRDAAYATSYDTTAFYINTTASLTGATLLGNFNRNKSLAPVETGADGWYKYTISIPLTFNTASNYLLMKGVSGYGNNIFVDDIKIYTPVTADAAPISFNPTAINSMGMTIGWTDNSTNETAFRLYRSTDNITFVKQGADIVSTSTATTGITYSQVQTGLLPGVTYYYRIAAVTDLESPYLTGNQATTAPGTIVSTATGGLWSATTTWVGGVLPTAGDNVTIADGATVTIDITTATCWDLTVGQGVSGVLNYLPATASTLTVNNGITIAVNGNFNAGTGALTTHALYIGGSTNNGGGIGSLINNGTFDMFGTAGVTITFFGLPDAVISGTGATLDLYRVVLNKGAITATSTVTPPVLDIQRAFTIQGANTLGFLTTHTAGTLKISGAFTQSSQIYTANYTIPAIGGVWLNNTNFTITGINGSPTNNGLLRLTSGTYNIGTGSGNSIGASAGAVFIIEGGTMTVAGRFLTNNAVTYNQSAGTVNVSNIGNTSTANGSFQLGSGSSVFNMSGGTIVLVQRNSGAFGPTTRDYYVVATPTITGGTLQIGTAATATNFNFRLYGYAPNTVIDNTTNNKKIEVYQTTGVLYILGNLTLNTGTTFDCLGFTAGVSGNVLNNGIIQGLIAGSRFDFQGTTPQTYSGTGTFGTAIAPFIGTGVGIANTANVTLNSPIFTTRTNLFTGTFINSNQFTLGIGAASSVYVQRGGSAGNPAGSFDVAPTFNVGTGGITVNYTTATTATTSGYEIPPSRTINNLIINNAPGVTLSGGALNTAAMTMTIGNVTTTAANLLTVTGTTTAAITYTAGYINGPVARNLPASLVTGSTYNLPVGKGSYNPFALVNPTTNAGGTVTVQAEVFDANCGGTPGVMMGALNSNRYWAASITNGSANFTNSLIQLNDLPNGADAIAASATQGGAYDLVGGTTTTATASSLTSTAPAATSIPGFFVMGNKAAATLTNLAISPTGNQCTNVARTITVTATPGGGAVTGVVINYSINGVAQTAIVMTNTSGNDWSGVIPTVTPANAIVTWSVTATDANLLTKTATGTPYTDEPAFGVTALASASSTTTCSGSPTTLSVSATKNGTVVIGTATTLTGATSQPTAFCNRWTSYRMQTIYTAAELTAAGLYGGPITSISYGITTLGDAATNANFTVKIGTTGLSVLTDFVSNAGFTTVFPAATYTHAIGVNTITFSTPYNWDGVSNIIIEVSHDGANSTNNAQTYYTATAGNTVAYSYNGGATGTLSNNRLNTAFTGNTVLIPSAYSWSDGTIVVGTTNPLIVNPTINTNYTATATISGCPVVSNTVNIITNTLPSIPTANNSNQCGTAVPGCSVTSTTGLSIPVFYWYTVPTGGTAIAGVSGSTYTGPAISATTIFYVSEYDGTCESNRVAVTANVTAPDPVTASVSASPICLGNSADLIATQTGSTQTYVYTWSASPAVGSGVATTVTGSPATITPTLAGTYTYTVTANDAGMGCATTSTISLTVNALPSGVTASASQVTVCDGSTVDLFSTPNSGAVTILNENFNGASNSWVKTNTSTGGASDSAAWTLRPDAYVYSGTTFHSNDNTQFYISNSDLQGSGGTTATTLESPAFSTVGQASCSLDFYHYFRSSGDSAKVQLFNGTSWVNLTSYTSTQGTATAFSHVTIPLNSYLGLPNVKIRFQYLSSWGWYWAIDNVAVSGVNPNYTYAWTSVPAGYTSALQNPTGIVVNGTTTYQVDVTNSLGCLSSASVPVTVNTLPTVPTANNSNQCGAAVPLCSVTSTTGLLSPVFYWYTVPTGGTAIAGVNGTNYTGALISTPTHFYVSEFNGTCESPRVDVFANVSAAPALTITADQTVCNNSAGTITVTSNLPDFNTYTWSPITDLYTNLACTVPYVALASATTVYVKSTTPGAVTYTCTSNNTSTNCSNVATTIVTITPVAPVISAPSDPFCLSGSVAITALPATGYGAATFQWQNSSDNITFADIVGATTLNYTTPVITSTTYYKLQIKLGASVCSESNVITVTINNPQITGTTPGTRCGTGTVTLGANGSAGATLNWYAAATGGAPLGTGSAFTTPVINSTTTYYVGAESYSPADIAFGTGTTLTSSTSYPTAFGNRWYQDWSQMVYTAAELHAVGLNAGNINAITLNIGALGSSATVSNYTISLGTTTNSVLTGFTTAGLTTCYGPSTYTSVVGANTITFATPFNWDGVSNIILDIRGTGINATYNATTTYTATTGNTVVYAYSSIDNTNYYTSNPTASASTSRLNVIFAGEGICSGPRSAVIATVNAPPAITVLASPSMICEGDTSNMTVTSSNTGYTYTWSPITVPAVGASVDGAPIATTVYYVTATDNSGGAYNGCVAVGTTTVNVNPKPVGVTASASQATISCGSSVNLFSTPAASPTNILSENFNGINTWTSTNTSTGGTPADAAWTLEPDAYIYSSTTFHSNDNSQFYMTNSDILGSGSTTATTLESPVFSTVGMDSCSLSFYQYYHYFSGDVTTVDVFNGTVWTTVATYSATQGTATAFVNSVVSLNSFVGLPAVKIRFSYNSSWGYYWAIDNVKVIGKQPNGFAWTSIPTGFTSALQNPTGVTPNATTTYDVIVTSPLGCSSTANTAVTVNPSPIINLGNDTIICFNSTMTLDAGAGASSYLWSTGATTSSLVIGPYTTAGAHTFYVTATTGTCSNTDTIVVTSDACLGITSLTDNANISIQPNPTNGLFSIVVSDFTGNDELSIFNYNGQLISKMKLNSNKEIINLSDYPSGIYNIVINDGKEVRTSRVVIQK
jgi:hypothetical protein